MTPEQELKLITDRLKIAGKGIILFHDPKAQTAAMLPAFLRYLRDNDYRVVHVVPASPAPNPEINWKSLTLRTIKASFMSARIPICMYIGMQTVFHDR
jgi:hypothetical protein